MNSINIDNTVDLFFNLSWKSGSGGHTDCYHAVGVNFWRDFLPEILRDNLAGKQTGDRTAFSLSAGELLAPYDQQKQMSLKNAQFDRSFFGRKNVRPCRGRFYPKGVLTGVPNVFRANVTPFRCGNVDNGHIVADFNHPLADKEIELSVIVGKVTDKSAERGGSSVDWMDLLTQGPGMQARWHDTETDFFSDDPFARTDENADAVFYHKPRLVQHIDETAINIVTSCYGRFLRNDMRVLDLMSSWQTYIPESLVLKELTGLGLNEKELSANRRLTDFRIQDLNQNPLLPFADNHFDAVICNVSVEYLTDPFTVFEEVARVLTPRGYFILTFSDRWFPPKAIRIWQELHDFERVGLVLEYFLTTGKFNDLQTYSVRGLPRPVSDKYFPQLKLADPVYAVWGRKK